MVPRPAGRRGGRKLVGPETMVGGRYLEDGRRVGSAPPPRPRPVHARVLSQRLLSAPSSRMSNDVVGRGGLRPWCSVEAPGARREDGSDPPLGSETQTVAAGCRSGWARGTARKPMPLPESLRIVLRRGHLPRSAIRDSPAPAGVPIQRVFTCDLPAMTLNPFPKGAPGSPRKTSPCFASSNLDAATLRGRQERPLGVSSTISQDAVPASEEETGPDRCGSAGQRPVSGSGGDAAPPVPGCRPRRSPRRSSSRLRTAVPTPAVFGLRGGSWRW